MLATLSAKSHFSVSVLKPHYMTQMKATAWKKLAAASLALALLMLLMVVLCRTGVSSYRGWAVSALAPGWHQTDTGDWDVPVSRGKAHLFISHFIIPHHAGKTKGGYPPATLPSCSYFPLVQTSCILGKHFETSAKWLIATVSPDGTEESCRLFWCQNQKTEHRYNPPWLSGQEKMVWHTR